MYLGKMGSMGDFMDIAKGIMDLYTGGAASTMFDAAGGASGGGGGAMPMMPSSTSVSPNIQTTISPQISPVFQQTGSGSQSASTSHIAPGGQSATSPGPASPALTSPGYATPSNYLPPAASGFPDPFYSDFDVRRYQPQGYSATEMIKAQNAPNWVMWGTLGAIALTALIILPPLFRRRKS